MFGLNSNLTDLFKEKNVKANAEPQRMSQLFSNLISLIYFLR